MNRKNSMSHWREKSLMLATAAFTLMLTAAINPAWAAKPGGGGGTAPPLDTGTICFTRYVNALGVSELWTMKPDGSSKQYVLTLQHFPQWIGTGYSFEPSRLSHAGKRWFLALGPVSGAYPNGEPRLELFALGSDGVSVVQLTDNPAIQPSAPTADGSTAYFPWPRWMPLNGMPDTGVSFVGRRWEQDAGGSWTATHGVLMVTLGNPEMLGAGVEHLPAQLAIELPAAAYNAVAGFDWSPDLSAVVFGFNQALWILTPGGTPALLAEEGRYPRWSPVQPDGRTQIAFFSAQLGGPADQRIESIDPAGAGRRTVVSGGTGRNATSINPNGMLHWSPHGTYLLYQAYSADAKGVYGYVYRVAADGTGSKALTDKTPSPACPRGWVE